MHDAETGTHYNYFRDYDPSTGRYIESDPIGLDGGSFSTYLYSKGNVAHLTTIVSPAKLKSYDGVKMLAGLPH